MKLVEAKADAGSITRLCWISSGSMNCHFTNCYDQGESNCLIET